MINLIPPVARKKVLREYWIRVVSVWFILVSIGFILITLLKLPVYVLVHSQLAAFSASYEAAASEDEQFTQLAEEIKTANETASILQISPSHHIFSEVIDKLDALANESVAVSEISIRITKDDTTVVTVAGEAATRIALARYKDSIEADEMFLTAELPLSNLAKDVEIPFTISVTLTNPSES